MEKKCRLCEVTKDLSEFGTIKRGGLVKVMAVCRSCNSTRRSKYGFKTNQAQWRIDYYTRMKEMRKDPSKNPEVVLMDMKAHDRRAGMECDLDLGLVRELLANGCSYCGETQIKITLDRIDNSKGHVKGNVVPACTRCNYTRGDMPYEAWLLVAEGMRKARELGLFGVWRRSAWFGETRDVAKPGIAHEWGS